MPAAGSIRSTDGQVSRWGVAATTLGVALILVVTLFPYDFTSSHGAVTVTYSPHISPDDTSAQFPSILSTVIDCLNNVLLFAPLGFALACLTRNGRFRGWRRLCAICVGGACISLGAESLQLLLPSRLPSLRDVLANTLGTLFGLVVFSFWGEQLLVKASSLPGRLRGVLTPRAVTIAFVVYAAAILVVAIPLQREAGLRNWNETFPLLIGNERTGNRPWRGIVYDLQIMDRALEAREVPRGFPERGLFPLLNGPPLVSYQWRNGQMFQAQAEDLPELVWKAKPPQPRRQDGLVLDGTAWLEMTSPPSSLIQRLKATSQFSLSTVIATSDPTQRGPARIVSLSADPYRRNFTLGQEGSHLVFRLRTPITGENGMKPELIAPHIFSDTRPHHIVITYDGTSLVLFVDGLRHPHAVELTPGATIFSHFMPLNPYDLRGYNTVYYGLMFIPIGILATLIGELMRRQSVVIIFVGWAGVLLIPLFLEILLSNLSGRSVSLHNVIISVLLVSAPPIFWSAYSRLTHQSVRAA